MAPGIAHLHLASSLCLLFVLLLLQQAGSNAMESSTAAGGDVIEGKLSIGEKMKPFVDSFKHPITFDHLEAHLKIPKMKDAVLQKSSISKDGFFMFLPPEHRTHFLIQMDSKLDQHKVPSQSNHKHHHQLDDHLWSFEPPSRAVTLENNHFLNFEWSGMQVKGYVVDERKIPMSKQEVLLKDAHSNKLVSRVFSDSDGVFCFHSILPGKYHLYGSEKIHTEKPITITDRGIFLKNPLIYNGFVISGRVLDSHSDLDGISLYLASMDMNVVKGCDIKGVPSNLFINMRTLNEDQQSKLNAVCRAFMNVEDGYYEFKNIPAGHFYVIPHKVGYVFSPIYQMVEVNSKNMKVPLDFRITGFKATGRVVNKNGIGIHHAALYNNGKKIGHTDAMGFYLLENTKLNEELHLEARLEHYEFGELVVLAAPTLPDIEPIRMSACGHIFLDAKKFHHNRKLKIRHVASGKELTPAYVKSDGSFCASLIIGDEYELEPVINNQEYKNGLLLRPSPMTVQVDAEPLSHLRFEQVTLSISGRIVCIHECGPIAVSIKHDTSHFEATFMVNKHRTEKPNHFSFKNLLPGKYHVSVHKAGWCWENERLIVDLLQDHTEGLILQQRGYKLRIISNRDNVHVKLRDSNDEPYTSHVLAQGQNEFCLAYPPTRVLKIVPSGCFRYEHDEYGFDTLQPRVVELNPTAVLVRGIVRVPPATDPEDVTIEVSHFNRDVGNDNNPDAPPLQTLSPQRVGDSLQYQFFARIGDEIQITPQSASLLFAPEYRIATISADENSFCPISIGDFAGEGGIFFRGSVEKLEGVEVSLIHDDGRELTTTLTNSDGHFLIGPFSPQMAKDASVIVKKPGYRMISVGDFEYQAEKSASILLQVFSVDEAEDQPMEDAFVYVRGPNMRRTGKSDSQGELVFEDLVSGDYFIKPIKKEYTFEEKDTQTVRLEEGQHLELTLKARRTSYSVYGSIRTLANQQLANIYVTASSPTLENASEAPVPVVEETISDEHGNYRLQGLNPGQEVIIQLAPNDAIERISPREHRFVMPSHDVTNISFTLYSSHAMWRTVRGRVECDDLFSKFENIHVELLTGKKVLQTQPLSMTGYFTFRVKRIDETRKLFVRIRGQAAVPVAEDTDKTIVLRSSQHHHLSSAVSGEDTGEIATTSYDQSGNKNLLLAVLVVFFSFLYRDTIWRIFQKKTG